MFYSYQIQYFEFSTVGVPFAMVFFFYLSYCFLPGTLCARVPYVADIPVANTAFASETQTHYPSSDDAYLKFSMSFDVYLGVYHSSHPHPPPQYFPHNQQRHYSRSPPTFGDVSKPQIEQLDVSLPPNSVQDSPAKSTELSFPQSVTAAAATYYLL